MIISHKHKYIFLCLPRTGTTAIRKELCENYDGEPIHYKHAPYYVFWKNASEEEKRYKVICSMRHPMDRIVSLYFKYKSDHDNINKGQIKEVGQKNFVQRILIRFANNLLSNRSKFVSKNNPTFTEYFLKFYKAPYSDWHSLYFNRYDYVIRFENIQTDFEKVVEGLGLKLKRPIPVVNKTKKESSHFFDHYTKETKERAIKVFSIALKTYDYNFPKGWQVADPSLLNRISYNIMNNVRKFYWEKVR